MSLPIPHPESITPAQLARARQYLAPTLGRRGMSLDDTADRLNVDARTLDRALWNNLGERR